MSRTHSSRAVALRLCAAALAVLAPAWPAAAQTTVTATWTGTSGNWSDPTNWSSNPFYPNDGNGGMNYNVIYNFVTNNGGTITLDVPITIEQMMFGGGAIGGASDLTINRLLTWTGGAFAGTGTTTLKGGANVPAGAVPGLDGALVNANGSVFTMAGSSTLGTPLPGGSGNAVWTNQTGAVFTLAGDAIALVNGSYPGTFINQAGATFQKTGGSGGNSTVNWNFTNNGTVNVTNGTVVFAASMIQNGQFTVGLGGGIKFASGSASTWTGTAGSSGAGTIIFAAGTGTYLFNGTNNLASAVTQSGGTIDGTGAMTISGPFTWTGGYVGDPNTPGPGTTTVTGGAFITTISPVLNRAVSNAAGSTAVLDNASTLYSQTSNAAWTNQAGSTFTMAGDNALGVVNTAGTFINQAGATFQKTSGTGVSTVSWNLSNSGSVIAGSGTLLLSGPISNVSGTTLAGGTWHVVGSAMLDFGASDVQALGTGTAVILEGPSSTFNVNSGAPIDGRLSSIATGSQLQILNGRSYTVANPGNAFTNNGTLLVSSTGSNSTFSIPDGIDLSASYNAATQTLTGGTWQVRGNANLDFGSRTITTIAAGTTVELTTIGSASAAFGAISGLATNNGTFLLLGGENFVTAGPLTNTGTIQVDAGMLIVNGAFNNTGTVQASGGGTVNVMGTTTVQSGASVIITAGTTYNGSGPVIVNSGGTLTVQGTVNQPVIVAGMVSGDATFGSSLTIQAGGAMKPGNSPGTIVISGGLTLNGDYDWDINGNDNTLAGGGISYSTVTVSGTTMISSASHLNIKIDSGVNFGDPFWTKPASWAVLMSSSGFSDATLPLPTVSPTAYLGIYPASLFSLSEQGNALSINWTPGAVRQSTFGGGGMSGNWSDNGNWNAPLLAGGDPAAQLVFPAQAGTPLVTNDLPGTFVLNALTFAAGSPVTTLAGNALEFRTNSAGSPPQLVSNSANAVTISTPLTLTNDLTVSGTGSVALTGPISGPGGLSMAGTGTLTLSAANSYAGGTAVQNGTVSVNADAALGIGNVTGTALGTLAFTGTTGTAKSFAMGGGTISVAAGKTVTFNGGTVSSALLDGPGTFATDAANGARFVNVAIAPPTAVTANSAADQFVHVADSGSLTVAAGVNAGGTSTTVTLNGFTTQGLGSVTLGASARLNAANFQSYGTLTLVPGSTSSPTQLTNLGAAPLGFNGGSRTFISIPAHAGLLDAGLDLHGNNAVVAGGLFVNNGYVVDSVGAGTKTVIADFGSLVKGAGFYENSVQTVNGGKFQSGNSPGKASFGSFTFGPGGVSNYVFAIDDATGTAGPSPDANGLVSGWGLVSAVQRPIGSITTPGDFAFTADLVHKLTVALDTLVNPTTVGTDVNGPMADFDQSRPYSWLAAEWAGSYTGAADAATLNAATVFDTTGFANPIAGAFGWSLDPAGHSLSLTYTPTAVPEPGGLALVGLAAVGLIRRPRRSRARQSVANALTAPVASGRPIVSCPADRPDRAVCGGLYDHGVPAGTTRTAGAVAPGP